VVGADEVFATVVEVVLGKLVDDEPGTVVDDETADVTIAAVASEAPSEPSLQEASA